MPAQYKILAIIPCFNEALSIGTVLDEFATLGFPCDTLVVDDGSTDGTAQVAEKKSKVLRFEQNKGLTAALSQGIRYAIDNDYDFCVQIDGDGQHIPAHIATLIAAYEKRPTHIMIGSRNSRLSDMAGGLNRIAALIISCMLYVLFGKHWFWDTTSGMRMMDRKAMQFFSMHLSHNQPDAVILPQALKAGLSVQEALVPMRPRIHGQSSFSGIRGVKFFFRVMHRILHIRFRETEKA